MTWNPDTDPDVLRYRRERKLAQPRLDAKKAAALAELRAILARVDAAEAERAKGGRPAGAKNRKGLTIVKRAGNTPKGRPKSSRCGTVAEYTARGCRCDLCRAAKSRYSAAWNAKQRAARKAA